MISKRANINANMLLKSLKYAFICIKKKKKVTR
jgi:hypothetical protein